MKQTELLTIPKSSTVLLDTNVLIDSIVNGRSFLNLYSQFAALETMFVLSEIVRLEFIRGFDHEEKPREFLRRIFDDDEFLWPLDKRIYELAYKIDRVYRKQGNKKVQLGDLLIAAQIARYSIPSREKGYPLLATENHKDFPPVIFDLIDVINVQIPSGAIKTVGLYKFNEVRFLQLDAQFA